MLAERALRIARLYVELADEVESAVERIVRRSDPGALAHRSVDTALIFDAMSDFYHAQDPHIVTIWVALKPYYEYDEDKTFRTTLGEILDELEAGAGAG